MYGALPPFLWQCVVLPLVNLLHFLSCKYSCIYVRICNKIISLKFALAVRTLISEQPPGDIATSIYTKRY
jgi:hypothetical protein